MVKKLEATHIGGRFYLALQCPRITPKDEVVTGDGAGQGFLY